jgi:hypothetical protein
VEFESEADFTEGGEVRTEEEIRQYAKGYAKGYATANKRLWPPHRPPVPSDAILGPIIEAARGLRDGFDLLIATTGGEKDSVFEELVGSKIDAFDRAMERLGEWVGEVPENVK